MLLSATWLHRQSDTYQDHTSIELHHGKLLIRLNTQLPIAADDASPGEKLRYYRLLHNLSQEELGRMVGFTKSGIVDFESGFVDIYYEHAVKFAEVFGLDPDVFTDDYARFCMPGYGKRVRKIRDMYGLTQQEFADQLGCDRSVESVWEAEIYNRHPRRNTYLKIRQLAEAIGIDIDMLMDDPDQYVDEYEAFIRQDCDKKIRYIRAAYGINQEEFGKRAGCINGSGAVSLWESGQTHPLRKNFLGIKKLAENAGIDLDTLNRNPETYKDDYSKFIERDYDKKISYLRVLRGVFQDKFGEMIGCSGNTVSEWEAGHCVPGRQYFQKIMDLAFSLGIKLDEWNEDPALYRDDYKLFLESEASAKLKSVRNAYQMSQAEFSKMIGVSRTAYQSWEDPKRYRYPSRDNFEIIKTLAGKKGIEINDA